MTVRLLPPGAGKKLLGCPWRRAKKSKTLRTGEVASLLLLAPRVRAGRGCIIHNRVHHSSNRR
jgi:hypothetical protein